MNKRISLLVGILFFALSILTLPHYGINWDTINHLPRGQAYLGYLLHGEKDYSSLPVVYQDWYNKNQWFYQDPDVLFVKTNLPQGQFVKRSYYQNDSLNFTYYVDNDGGGHPPASDILSALFNRVFYANLKLVNDIDSYRLFGVFIASVLVALVCYWAGSLWGLRAGLSSALLLASYPLFWSESHFNTEKDIPVAAFWSLFMFFSYKAILDRKIKWFVFAGVVGGLGLGTKFNMAFSVFVIVPWFLYSLFLFKKRSNAWSIGVKVSIGFLLSAIISVSIFVALWPYLWADPIGRIQSVVDFYKEIGSTTSQPIFNFLGFNLFPILWIAFTTPIYQTILLLVGVGILVYKIIKREGLAELLFLLWLSVPIIRVIAPHANTYGGVRQLMEFVPAMAIIAGYGYSGLASFLSKIKGFNKVLLIDVLFVILFSLHVLQLSKIHPYENTYFNSLIGGLSGAKAKDFPFWGFSFGGPYRSAVSWINKNAEQNSTLVFAYELIPNFPRLWLRPDIKLINADRSGYLMNGEYAITLNYDGTDERSYYDGFLVKFIKPVFQGKVDGVPVVTVWKNSPDKLISEINEISAANDIKVSENEFTVNLKELGRLWRLEILYKEDKKCKKLAWAYIEISTGNGTWERLPGVLPDDWRISRLGEQPKGGKFMEPFLGQNANQIRVNFSPEDACLKNITSSKVFVLN